MDFPKGENDEQETGLAEELDLESMDDQKAQDLADIGRLQKQVDLLASRITIRDVT